MISIKKMMEEDEDFRTAMQNGIRMINGDDARAALKKIVDDADIRTVLKELNEVMTFESMLDIYPKEVLNKESTIEDTQMNIEILFENFKRFLIGKVQSTTTSAANEELIEDFKVFLSQDNNTETEVYISILVDNFKAFLIEKNKRYGNSAIEPVNIFSKEGSVNQTCNRLDDKLMRIKTSNELRMNDVADTFGYIALLMIQNGWIDFEELLD